MDCSPLGISKQLWSPMFSSSRAAYAKRTTADRNALRLTVLLALLSERQLFARCCRSLLTQRTPASRPHYKSDPAALLSNSPASRT